MDSIAFTEWQIDKIRVALNRYRIANANNGRLISWTRVRDDITNSDANIDRYSEDDAELAFKPEALRRFAANISVLELNKLKDVLQFLVHDDFIRLEDLDERDADLKGMLAVHEYLAEKTDSAKKFLSIVDGIYTACLNRFPDVWETFTLRIMTDPSKEFVRVEEIYEISSADISHCETLKQRQAYLNTRKLATGYGFAVAEDNCLHIFLAGVDPSIRTAYVQVAGYTNIEFIEAMCLVRHGHRHWGQPYRNYHLMPDGSLQILNAFQFISSNIAT